jgi:hypothetical protein
VGKRSTQFFSRPKEAANELQEQMDIIWRGKNESNGSGSLGDGQSNSFIGDLIQQVCRWQQLSELLHFVMGSSSSTQFMVNIFRIPSNKIIEIYDQ